MFIRGEYAADQDDAGMLGYVQTGEPMTWATQVDDQLRAKSADHAVCAGGEWNRCSVAVEVSMTFRSVHDRVSVGRPVTIFHTFLMFQ